ncbi:MAG: gliding motility-associated C-terminal domain-containing protein [Bacteroidetes bacterium]|nr:MAG: gliding motility-associated C-terminal domain-containing protein [Bacteroidota bacterium]
MKTLVQLISFLLLSGSIMACNVDVVINEGTSITICQGSGTTINASAGYVSYSWSGPSTGTSASLTPTQSGTYTVDAEDALGCISSASISVMIALNPTPTLISSEGNVICNGLSTAISTIQGYNSYLWSTGSTQALITVNQGGVYTVEVVDANGCLGNAAILINEPNFSLTTNTTTVCLGGTALLTAGGGGTYSWSTGEIGSSIVVGPTQNTTYSVTITNGSCTETLDQLIYVEQIPSASIQDTFYVQPGVSIAISGPEGYDEYSWFPYDNLSAINLQNTSFSGNQSTTYAVVSSLSQGCQRIDSIWVFVIDLTIPTGFSPNGDQTNDRFVIPELEFYSGDIIIWNRWGDKVFESDNYQNNWDGTCKEPLCLTQGPLPEGTYYYQITVKDLVYNGFTTLKR